VERGEEGNLGEIAQRGKEEDAISLSVCRRVVAVLRLTPMSNPSARARRLGALTPETHASGVFILGLMVAGL